MSDITGDAITVHAAENIVAAIEPVGTTSAKQQVSKAIEMTATGAKLASASTAPENFIGVVKAVSGEAGMVYAQSKNISAPIRGASFIPAPFFEGPVTVYAGAALTVERHCISYVLGKDTIKFNDNLALDADGKFKTAGSGDAVVAKALSDADANGVVRASILRTA